MSDRQIQVGDLVMVKQVCCDTSVLGVPFIVSRAILSGHYCTNCGKSHTASMLAIGLRDYGVPFSWLKRIPPLDELEGRRTEEKLRLPKPVTV